MANEAMWTETVETNGENLTRDRKKEAQTRKRNLGRSKPLKPVSKTQKELLERWAYIKRCFIIAQVRTQGFVSCMTCGLVVDDDSQVDLDHIVPTGKGGTWTMDNADLKCNYLSSNAPNSCHETKHGQPQWTGSGPRD